jgi:hypothetical protein
MSIKKEWQSPDLRVWTQFGPGKVVVFGKYCSKVKLDELWAGGEKVDLGNGEIVLENNFTVVRAINCDGLLIANVQNYPSWEEALTVLEQPFSQNETLIALNFQEKIFKTNRDFPSRPYLLVEVYFDMYTKSIEEESKVYYNFEEAKDVWQKVEQLCGTSGHIFLCALVDLEKSKILGRAAFCLLKIINKDQLFIK